MEGEAERQENGNDAYKRRGKDWRRENGVRSLCYPVLMSVQWCPHHVVCTVACAIGKRSCLRFLLEHRLTVFCAFSLNQ